MKTKLKKENIKSNKNKLVLIPLALLLSISSFLAGTKYEKQIKDTIKNQPTINKEQVLDFPKEAKVKRVIDGDTIELENGVIVRYVGITAPETGDLFEEEATEENKRLVEGKKIKLEYDSYKSDRFGRILAYVIIENKNLSLELARKGLAKVVIYEKRKPLIYQQQLVDAEKEAKSKKLGIWSLPK